MYTGRTIVFSLISIYQPDHTSALILKTKLNFRIQVGSQAPRSILIEFRTFRYIRNNVGTTLIAYWVPVFHNKLSIIIDVIGFTQRVLSFTSISST